MKVIAAGDCGVDRYLDLRADRAGGISLNVAVNVRAEFTGNPQVGVVSVLGNDGAAGLLDPVFATSRLSAFVGREVGPSSIQYIDHEPSGEKIFVRYEPGVLASYHLNRVQRQAIAASDLLITAHFAGIEGFVESVMSVPSTGLRCVDFGALRATEPVMRYLDRLHVAFFGLTVADTALIDALEALAIDRHRLFVVTLAADGALALGGPRRLHQPALPVTEVIDTTGAGDTYIASFLSEYHSTRDVERAMHKGARAGARAVSQVGAFSAPLVPWTQSPVAL